MNVKNHLNGKRFIRSTSFAFMLALTPYVLAQDDPSSVAPRLEQGNGSSTLGNLYSHKASVYVLAWPKVIVSIFPTALAQGRDTGPADGEFDDLTNSTTITWNGFTESRIAAEFDISALRGSQIADAMLTGQISHSTGEGDRGLRADAYAGDGVVDLQDFTRVGSLGERLFPIGRSEFVFDVTLKLQAMADTGNEWIGVNLRESPECPDEFDCTTLSISGLELLVTTDGPLELIFADNFEGSRSAN